MAGNAEKFAATALPKLLQSFRGSLAVKYPLPSLRRAFSLYDQVNLFADIPEDRIRIDGCTDTGFIANNTEYKGSLMCIENLILSWRPKQLSEVTVDSLSVFKIIRPVPEIVVLGCGKRTELVDPNIRNFLRSNGIKLEAVDSWNAAGIFNILNEERRAAVAALLPMSLPNEP
eukprot:TRINITY_DN13697_c0_g2_i1.p1 TRINITY_DN13697_c0_g2~~TRINITY_DN13697_c0_g2_i1.p1  ORF type:complete len:173 (+),score=25.42 TRINITY_DN13697_c0_g2_i1:79-597(+)